MVAFTRGVMMARVPLLDLISMGMGLLQSFPCIFYGHLGKCVARPDLTRMTFLLEPSVPLVWLSLINRSPPQGLQNIIQNIKQYTQDGQVDPRERSKIPSSIGDEKYPLQDGI